VPQQARPGPLARDTQPIITVFGNAQPREGELAWQEAYEVGQRLAQAGYVLCNGGTSGTMRAAALGARAAGGRVVGITMDVYLSEPPDSWLDEEVRVGDLFVRLQRLILPANGFICLRGGCGTLAEWALTWTLLASRLIPAVPLILLGAEWRPFLATIRTGMISRETDWPHLQVVDTVDEALTLLREQVGKSGSARTPGD
jgi:uncharacterized protein (TIGR00730 family)